MANPFTDVTTAGDDIQDLSVYDELQVSYIERGLIISQPPWNAGVFSEWVNGGAYIVDQLVWYGSWVYICIANINPSITAPPSDTTHWDAWDAAAGIDIQSKTQTKNTTTNGYWAGWATLQNFVMNHYDKWVADENETFSPSGENFSTDFNYQTFGEFCSAANLHHDGVGDGFRRSTVNGPPVFSIGTIQTGDVIGYWLIEDLQNAFSAMKWTWPDLLAYTNQTYMSAVGEKYLTKADTAPATCAGQRSWMTTNWPAAWTTSGPWNFGYYYAMSRKLWDFSSPWYTSITVKNRSAPKFEFEVIPTDTTGTGQSLLIPFSGGGDGSGATDGDLDGMFPGYVNNGYYQWGIEIGGLDAANLIIVGSLIENGDEPLDLSPNLTCANTNGNALQMSVQNASWIFKWDFTYSD